MNWLERSWYKKTSWITWLLSPLTVVFWLASIVRTWLYQVGLKRSENFGIPVVVVGNISVGGNGKTPFVIWLGKYLQARGLSVAVVSRGYGSKAPNYPYVVSSRSSAIEAGDEPRLIADNLNCPVVIAPKRNDAIAQLIDKKIDVIISDDGLQHYAMARDIEFCIVDSKRRFGNEWLMPSGPLRESVKRTKSVDLIVENGGEAEFRYDLHVDGIYRVRDNTPIKAPMKANVVTAIGHPERFINTLKQAGIETNETLFFPDHHPFNESDFRTLNNEAVIMTEKDAVKCRLFCKENWYYLKVAAQVTPELENQVETILKQKGILNGI
ncbi:Tetraacyldisaccharide 4'-kinase [Pseudoalteromonas luteoviolacea B = ATCC 29581]|nr:Tetraacyldisaccharide 4'-kinase [Pseudoalteromonas luteoviolacea B = ATCC 29581]